MLHHPLQCLRHLDKVARRLPRCTETPVHCHPHPNKALFESAWGGVGAADRIEHAQREGGMLELIGRGHCITLCDAGVDCFFRSHVRLVFEHEGGKVLACRRTAKTLFRLRLLQSQTEAMQIASRGSLTPLQVQAIQPRHFLSSGMCGHIPQGRDWGEQDRGLAVG